MEITIKNVKHSEFASHETHCFQATVYVDGKRAFITGNDGNGGPDYYHPADKKTTMAEVDRRVAEINAELSREKVEVFGDEIPNSLEMVIREKVNEWLVDRDIRKALKKTLIDKGDGAIYSVKARPCEETFEKVRQASWWKPEYKILNTLPFEEVRKHFTEQEPVENDSPGPR